MKLTPAIIEQAKSAGAITGTMYAGALPFSESDNTQRSPGIEFKTYTITVPIDENLKLKDNDGNQVYPALPYVAQVDGKKKYLTLDAALKAASSGQTVNAIAACEAGTFTVGKNVTVNLYNYGAASGASYEFIDVSDLNMSAKVVSTKAETVTTKATGFAVKNENNTYTIYRSHIHTWEFALNGATLTANCTNMTTDCDIPDRTTAIELTVTGGSDGVAPTFAIANQEAFLASVNKFASIASIGSITTVRTTEDGAALSRWYVGNYKSTCDVTIEGEGTLTLVKEFSIAKPEGGYTSGWEVGSTGIRYLEADLSIVYATAQDGDTIYYRDGNRDNETHEYSVGNKNLTFDFGGATLTKSAYKTMTLKNTGAGTLTFQNVTIQQPKGTFSGQIEASGNIAFGTGVLVTNTASDDNNRCKVTSTSGKLSVLAGIYQCKFVESDGDVEISGGYFWYNDHCKPDNNMLATNYIVREITIKDEKAGTSANFYEVVYHEHHPVYSAKDNVVSATCDAQDHEYCGFGTQTATLNAPNAVETGSAYAGASIDYSDGFPGKTNTVADIVYVTTVAEKPVELTYVPSLFGAYTATLKIGGATAEKTFEITLNKDDPTQENDIPYVPKGSDEPIAINVSSQFIADNIDTTGKSTTDIMAELNEDGENGIPKVESYVLGLDPKVATSIPVAQPVQTSSADKLTLTVGNIDVKEDAGAKVMYSVVTADTPEGLKEATPGEKQDSPTFELDLPADGVMYYRAKIDLVKPE